MAYATPAQLLERFDLRVIGDLASDADVRVTAAQIPTNARVLAALEDASGAIRSAALARGAYSDGQLDAFALANDPLLVRLTCSMAMVYMAQARGRDTDEGIKIIRSDVRQHLNDLRSGIGVLGGVVTLASSHRTDQGTANQTLIASTSRLFPSLNRGHV